jgi:hypothetical protein
LKDTAYIVGVVLAVIVASGIAFVYLTSRYRKAADAEKDKYIAALEARNQFLEDDKERRDREYEATKRRLATLEGKVCTLQELVLRRCRNAEIDPGSGACRHCAMGMAYGQGGVR